MPRRLRRSKRLHDVPLTANELMVGTIRPSPARVLRACGGHREAAEELLDGRESGSRSGTTTSSPPLGPTPTSSLTSESSTTPTC